MQFYDDDRSFEAEWIMLANILFWNGFLRFGFNDFCNVCLENRDNSKDCRYAAVILSSNFLSTEPNSFFLHNGHDISCFQ